jgi:hypothetical protein
MYTNYIFKFAIDIYINKILYMLIIKIIMLKLKKYW